jgi:Cohesin
MQDDESAAESQSTVSRSKRRSLDDDKSDNDDDDEEEEGDDDTSKNSNGNESDDPEFTTSSRRKSPRGPLRSSPSQNMVTPKATTPSPAKKRSTRSRAAPSIRNASGQNKPIQTALQSLSKKVLVAQELKDPSQSLVASLLLKVVVSSSSRRQGKNGRNDDLYGTRAGDVEDFLSRSMSGYTNALFAIARDIVSLYNSDPNRAQVRLVNLLFRSVGGTTNSELEEDKVQLEEMGNEEWGDVVTDLVDDMRYTPESCVLFCSDPDGAVHYSAVVHSIKDDLEKREQGYGNKGAMTSLQDVPVTASSLGVREYRKIYQEFWYVLGHVALVEGGMSASASVVPFTEDEIDDSSASDGDGEDNKKSKQKKASKSAKDGSGSVATRFDTEVVRDILSRLVELVSVGQPDIRAAASTAVYSMGQAILDKTVRLSEKLQIVTRQFAAAVGGKGKKNSSAKAESLRFQIDSLRRTRETLDEIIEALVIKGVFIHRYRDSNMFNRASSIHALADMVIRRPDVFLKDKYLKYFGWMLSDKAECVRMAALEGLNRPFEEVENAKKAGQETSIDLSHLEHVSAKFLKRISETVIDVHSSVQERGVKLMLSLLRAGFLDEVDDEYMWNQVNLLAFETDSTSAVRRDALYFIMEQLEEFDDGDDEGDGKSKKRKSLDNTPPSDKKAAQRLDAIASWAAHTLTDGNVPLEKIQIDLVHHLVNSLRDMPEHKDIVTNWNAMIRAISEEKIATTSQGNAAGAKADLAKQRVLVEFWYVLPDQK